MTGPGKTIGIFGGGQLGRMTAIEARKMGFHIHIFEPSPNPPAGETADLTITAPYEDDEAVRRFLNKVDVATFEFENIPALSLEKAAKIRPLHPSPEVLLICQNREREKSFLKENGFPHAGFAVVSSAEELKAAIEKLGTPSVLKTAAFGYDGKGQIKINPGMDPETVWNEFGNRRGVLEKWISYHLEFSVICAISPSGEAMTFPLAENIHTNHILDFSIVPARINPETADKAREIALKIAKTLNLTGLIAVEFFLTTDGEIMVNELAPRPHNSGHFSFDASITSQFEQQVRAVCGLPLGSGELLSPIVMCNLLGDLWAAGEPDWNLILKNPRAKLHLYGKKEARPGRKMGHFTIIADDAETALREAQSIKQKLTAAAEFGTA